MRDMNHKYIKHEILMVVQLEMGIVQPSNFFRGVLAAMTPETD